MNVLGGIRFHCGRGGEAGAGLALQGGIYELLSAHLSVDTANAD